MSKLNQLAYKTLTQTVADEIRERIISGRITAGQRIQQDELALEFNVSKNPIREALFVLRGEGFITFERNKGAIAQMLDIEQLDEIFALKILLATNLLAESFNNMTEKKLAEASNIITAVNNSRSATQWCKHITQFYHCLYSGTHRPQTLELLSVLSTKIEYYSRLHFLSLEYKAAMTKRFGLLINCCQQGNLEQAINLLTAHFIDTKGHIKQLF